MNSKYEIFTAPTTPAQDYVNDVIGAILEQYYDPLGWMTPVNAEYTRGIIDALYHIGQLTVPERDIYQFMIDKLATREGNTEL